MIWKNNFGHSEKLIWYLECIRNEKYDEITGKDIE
jgi:hypothetical protein